MKLQFPKTLKEVNQQLTEHFVVYATIIVVVLIALGFVFLINPKITEIRSFGILNLRQTQDQLSTSKENLRITSSIVDQYRQLSGDELQKLKAALPADSELPAMFVQVEAIALSSGLRLNNVSFTNTASTASSTTTKSAASGPAGLRQMQVSFTVVGGHGYASLKNFLATLETSVRLLDVQALTYTPLKSTDEETYVISAVTYFQ